MVQFRLFGIPVTVQPWHWILLGLLGFNWGNGTALQAGLFALAGFLSILVHEMGHALTGRAFRAPAQIVMLALGGVALFPANSFTRLQNFLVTAAGPAAQAALGGLVYLLFINITDLLPNDNIRFFFEVLIDISFLWAIFNLVPIFPLDGGQLVDAILGPKLRLMTLSLSIVTALSIAGFIYFASNQQNWLFPLLIASFAFQNFTELRERNAKKKEE